MDSTKEDGNFLKKFLGSEFWNGIHDENLRMRRKEKEEGEAGDEE